MSKRRRSADLERALEELLSYTAGQLRDIISKGLPVISKEGEPVIDPSTGEILRQPAPPAYFTAAITLLKNNGVEFEPDNEEMSAMKKSLSDLPFEVPEEGTPYKAH